MFKTQQQQARVSLKRKWGMLCSGRSYKSKIRKEHTYVTSIPAVCYGSHLWDLDVSISAYSEVKATLRMPYKPPTQLMPFYECKYHTLRNQTVNTEENGMKQLAYYGNLAILASTTKLNKLLLTYMKKIRGHHRII